MIEQHAPIFEQVYRIYLEDTDAGGIVYHANHLKLFERCRRDWLRTLGMTHYFYQTHSVDTAKAKSDSIQFVVSQANVAYRQPILLDSLVTVAIEQATVKGASLRLQQSIWLNNVMLSSAEISLVCVTSTQDNTGQTRVRPARLPVDFIKLLS